MLLKNNSADAADRGLDKNAGFVASKKCFHQFCDACSAESAARYGSDPIDSGALSSRST